MHNSQNNNSNQLHCRAYKIDQGLARPSFYHSKQHDDLDGNNTAEAPFLTNLPSTNNMLQQKQQQYRNKLCYKSLRIIAMEEMPTNAAIKSRSAALFCLCLPFSTFPSLSFSHICTTQAYQQLPCCLNCVISRSLVLDQTTKQQSASNCWPPTCQPLNATQIHF